MFVTLFWLSFGWVLCITCAYMARAVKKTSNHGESLMMYVFISGTGLGLAAAMSWQLWKDWPELTVAVNLLFILLGVTALPIKRAYIRRVDATQQN